MSLKAELHRRYRTALANEPLPAALVDLEAVEHNVDVLAAPIRAQGKGLRIASKSVRCLELLRIIAARAGAVTCGVMCFSPEEACWLAASGFPDVLVAYPTTQAVHARRVAAAVARGAMVRLVADSPRHLAIASEAAAGEGVRIPIVVDVDVSYRPFGKRFHLGVRRSPLREPAEVAEFVERVRCDAHLSFAGLQAYEAQLAGVPDVDALARGMKRLAREAVRAQRAQIVSELARRGIEVPLFNGGGTGSVVWSAADPSLSEVAVGSGFLDSHLFDGYRGVELVPAAFFALCVTRHPATGIYTCQSGGFVASGASGRDRLPRPYLPEGLELLEWEGAGEVQTPLAVSRGMSLELGEPVVFRHAKAGELAEHFASYALIRGEAVEARVPTYRGQGHCFH